MFKYRPLPLPLPTQEQLRLANILTRMLTEYTKDTGLWCLSSGRSVTCQNMTCPADITERSRYRHNTKGNYMLHRKQGSIFLFREEYLPEIDYQYSRYAGRLVTELTSSATCTRVYRSLAVLMETDDPHADGIAGLEAFRTELRVWIKSGYKVSVQSLLDSLVDGSVVVWRPFKDPLCDSHTSAAALLDTQKLHGAICVMDAIRDFLLEHDWLESTIDWNLLLRHARMLSSMLGAANTLNQDVQQLLETLLSIDVMDENKVWQRTSLVSEAFAEAMQVVYDIGRGWYLYHDSSTEEQEYRTMVEAVMNQANRYMLELNRNLWRRAHPTTERFIDLHDQRAENALIELKWFLLSRKHKARVNIVVGIGHGSLNNIPSIKPKVIALLQSVDMLDWEINSRNPGQVDVTINIHSLRRYYDVHEAVPIRDTSRPKTPELADRTPTWRSPLKTERWQPTWRKSPHQSKRW